MSNIELSSYFRSESAKLGSKEKISDEELSSIFSESLKFITKNLDNFLLSDLLSLIQNCWHRNPLLLWDKNSEELIKISQKNFNTMCIILSISPITLDMKSISFNPEYKAFFEKFVFNCFHELNELYSNIENQACDAFLVFDQIFNRKQFFYFLFQLVQAIPYSEPYIPKYLHFLFSELPPIDIYSLYSFFISNNLINFLPRSIYNDRNFLEYTSLPNSLILLNGSSDDEFLNMFQFYFKKIYNHKFNNSQIAYKFLERISKTNSEHIIHFMNKLSSAETKNRIQTIIDFASDCDFSKEVLLNLKKFKFHLPENVSKKIKSLDEDPEYLSIIIYNPLVYMDRKKLDPILLSSDNPQVYNNLFHFIDYNDPIFLNLSFWSHIIPFFKKNTIQLQLTFIRVNPATVSKRISELFLFNFPQNMKPEFFDFAKRTLSQENSSEAFTNSDETKILLSQIQGFVPFDFWKLFSSYDPILAIIDKNYEKNLPLTLGLSYFLIHRYLVHISQPDPQIKFFKIMEQTEQSIQELYSLIKNKIRFNTILPNLSDPALSVVTAAYLYSSFRLNNFVDLLIEGLNDDIFVPFFIIVVNNLATISSSYWQRENTIYRFNNRQREMPFISFLSNSDYSKRLVSSFNFINYQNPEDERTNAFICSVLNLFINFNSNIVLNEPLTKILKIFSEHQEFYLRLDSPNAKLYAQFFARLLLDIFKITQTKPQKEFIVLIKKLQNNIIRLLIAHPYEYSSKLLDSQAIKKIIYEEKAKGDNNYNIILFIMKEITQREKDRTPYFKGDELLLLANQAIEENNLEMLNSIINYGKDQFSTSFVPLLDQKIPIDIKLTILCKVIPIDIKFINISSKVPDARNVISMQTLISLIKEINNISLFKKFFEFFFYFLLDEQTMINYFILQFESQYDFTPINDIKRNAKLDDAAFETAFKKFFQIIVSGRKKFVIKRPIKPELEQPSEFTHQFLNLLIAEFLEKPSWQILTMLYFIASNFPFLFIFTDKIESIFENLFGLFDVFEKYQAIPFTQKQAYNKKHRQTDNIMNHGNILNNIRYQIQQAQDNFFNNPFLHIDDEEFAANVDDNNNKIADQKENEKDDESDLEIINLKDQLFAAYSGLSFLNAFVSIPTITDKFFQWALSNFSNLSKGQIISFLATLIPILNRETAQHVAFSYLIKYDWISLFKNYYQSIEKPISKFSRYILANLIRITYSYFLKYLHTFTPEMAATCDELMKYDNPFEIAYDHRAQISPIFSPWLSLKEYQFKTEQFRNVLNGNQLNLDVNQGPNMFFDPLPFIQNRVNRQASNNERQLVPPFAIGRLNFNERPGSVPERPSFDVERNNGPFSDNEADQRPMINNDATANANTNASNEDTNANVNSNANNPTENDENENDNDDNENANDENLNEDFNNLRRSNIARAFGPAHNFDDIPMGHHLRVIRNRPFANPANRSSINRLINNGVLHQVFSTFNRLPRAFHQRGFNDFPSRNDNFPFWALFHLSDDEMAFVKDSIFSGDGVTINYSAGTSLTSQQFNSLIDQDVQLDLSGFDRIQNLSVFDYLDQITIAAILKNQLKLPQKVTPQMHRYLISQPQWITAYLSSPPTILLTPQHYVVLQQTINTLKQIQESEGDETEKSKAFLADFKSNIHSKCEAIIDIFLSPNFTLTFLSNFELRNGMFTKTFNLMCDTLKELASADSAILDLILEKISNGISELNPIHIEHLLNILVFMLDCPNFNRHFSLNLLQKMIQVVGSPSICSQSSILETTAKFLVTQLSSRFFYTKVETKSPCSYSDIEKSTLQIFSILFNSSNLQIVNNAMNLVEKLKDDVKDKLSSIILDKFDLIYERFVQAGNDDNAVTSIIFSDSTSQSLISLFISSFINIFPKFAVERKTQLLFILKRILQLKNKNISLISSLINCLCPKRSRQVPNNVKTDDNNNNNNNSNNNNNNNNNVDIYEMKLTDEKADDSSENSNNKQILIPMSYYNKAPEFWQIIFDNLSWFQEQVNENQAIIEGKFKFLKNYMELLTFKQKSYIFKKDQSKNKIRKTTFELQVRRKEILTDSFYKFRPSSLNLKDNILSNIRVKFTGEPGYDMGGLTRDWFTSLVKELFNPNYALFKSSENGRSYQPNPLSNINSHHLEYFEFAGLIIARAIIGGICVDAHLTTSFIKQILGAEVTLRDLEDVDKEMHNSLVWMLNNSVKDLDLRFTDSLNDIDTSKTVELKENGENIVVTDENKKEYIKLLCQYRMTIQIQDQINAFLKGFYKLIKRNEIILFTPTELDLLICGVPEIDVDDLRRNCEFYSPYSSEHPVIKMFFNVISKWGHEDLAKLLLFITGSSQVPIGGFKMMKESRQPIIIAPGGDNSRLPQAHTCMNTLDLPNYQTEEILENKLLLSISECQNFGFN